MAQKTQNTIPNPIQVQKFLGGVDYPAGKAALIQRAKERGADENVLNALNQMGTTRYNSPNDVSEEIGKLRQCQTCAQGRWLHKGLYDGGLRVSSGGRLGLVHSLFRSLHPDLASPI